MLEFQSFGGWNTGMEAKNCNQKQILLLPYIRFGEEP